PSSSCINTVCGGKAHFKLRPIVLRTQQPQLTAMQSGQFAREAEADPMARCGGGTRAVMKPFEDVFPRWNRTTSVSDRQHHGAAVAMRANPNSPARTIVLSRVLQEILHDQRCVAFLSGHKKPARKFLFNLH